MSESIRRGQLIAPFGVGAISVLKGGLAVIGAGLDHWFEREDSPDAPLRDIDKEEFRVDEPRLERVLQVDKLYLPPDSRRRRQGQSGTNRALTVPFLRFPQWHTCNFCHDLRELPLTARGRQYCLGKCAEKDPKTRNRLVQVRFIAICERGHIQDFPWRQWVHRSVSSKCRSPMTLTGTGGASLAALWVKCECGAERDLGRIMEANPEASPATTFLSRRLDAAGGLYLCTGQRPWLGPGAEEGCGQHVRGSLLNATNVHFAKIESSIYLPAEEVPAAPTELVDLLDKPPLSTLLQLFRQLGTAPEPTFLRNQHGPLLRSFSDDQVAAAVDALKQPRTATSPVQSAGADDHVDVPLRLEEYRVLRTERRRDQLQIRLADVGKYGDISGRPFADYFEGVSLVEKLRETRAFAGFTRIKSEQPDIDLQARKRLLWRGAPSAGQTWLPAYVVYGEGIFLQFRTEAIRKWEDTMAGERAVVPARVERLLNTSPNLLGRWGSDARGAARFVMLHTVAHLLINRLVFDCGYSSASLRERLYISNDAVEPMTGILIYTAAGDSEGTMGGLVRMGKPGRLEHTIQRALEGALWCSADPVCMEMAERGGQGPDSCNLAACHNCALVPETSCEQFNRYIDRGLVVGTMSHRELGFFSIG